MTQEWAEVGMLEEDLSEGEPINVIVQGHDVALYRVEGKIFATGNICTHGQARLCEGYLEGYEIECPLHQGRFDVRSGKALFPPVTVDIRTYSVKVQSGRIWLGLQE